jgi:hypothetical protein
LHHFQSLVRGKYRGKYVIRKLLAFAFCIIQS